MLFARRATPSQCRALDDLRMAGGSGAGRAWSISTRCYRVKPAISTKQIFKTSLEKTLEAHRIANRASLIRPIYDHNSPSLGVYRPPLFPHLQEIQKPPLPKSKTKTPKTKKPKLENQTPKPARRVSISVQGGDGVAQHPWLDLVQRKDENSIPRLDAEITALAEFIQPSYEENLVIARIVHQISEQVSGVVPRPPQLVGSRSTQTAFSSSGIDLMVRVGDENPSASGQRTLNPTSSKIFAGILQRVEAAVRDIPDYDEVRILPAKSPTLVMTHKTSGLPINIFCGNKLPSADEYIKTSLAGTPSLQPLYMVLRAILESRNIFGWETASVGSYGLILLVASFLKQQNTQFQQKGLGEQLLDILDLYGSKLNLRTTGVAVEPAEFFDFASVRHKYETRSSPRSDPVLVGQRALLRFKANARKKSNFPAAKHLCIQDPTNYLNDVGLQCTRTTELRKILCSVSIDLQLAVKRWDGERSILSQVLHANFEEFGRIRTSLTV
ncbi:hypothetical protein PISL3812_00650 [Talaromyces islandicus]|uniref:Polynucleotide adenylyltransferase n=1 Tax=Talaromyces islandicus TaxID=28573 RepID=A0A0U1LJV7_TALIS|nr:hypothetical protein PISL3812_00650 [Talaromyces islandicus]